MIILPCEWGKDGFDLVIFAVSQLGGLQSSTVLPLYKYNEEECYHKYQLINDLPFFLILQKMLISFDK